MCIYCIRNVIYLFSLKLHTYENVLVLSNLYQNTIKT